jgi:hypothetical protein
LIVVIFFILIAFVNIPFVREGLTGMSQYQYLAPLPENYAANNGIDEAYLTKFYTYQEQVQNGQQNNPNWTPTDTAYITASVQAYLNNKPQGLLQSLPYKEEMDFYLTNGYFPYNQFLMNFLTQFGQQQSPPQTAQQLQQRSGTSCTNRCLFGMYNSTPQLSTILKTIDGYNEAYQTYMGTSTPSSTTSTTTSTPPSTTSSTTTANPVTLNDFLNLCKRATSSQ